MGRKTKSLQSQKPEHVQLSFIFGVAASAKKKEEKVGDKKTMKIL